MTEDYLHRETLTVKKSSFAEMSKKMIKPLECQLRGRDDYALARPISHERERSRVDRGSIDHEHDDEIIVRRDEREGGRVGDRQREEIINRHHSRSPSPDYSFRAPPPLEPAPIYAPPIHCEIIYYKRYIDHGYETALAKIPSRAPSPPMPPPPPPRERAEERIEIRRAGELVLGWSVVRIAVIANSGYTQPDYWYILPANSP
jgi:hypothetical protein